jgi:hypothetical protein
MGDVRLFGAVPVSLSEARINRSSIFALGTFRVWCLVSTIQSTDAERVVS